jgi:hypothetical protein
MSSTLTLLRVPLPSVPELRFRFPLVPGEPLIAHEDPDIHIFISQPEAS